MLIAKKLTYIGITLRIMLNIERQIENFKIKIHKNSDLLKNGSSSIKKVEKSVFLFDQQKEGVEIHEIQSKKVQKWRQHFFEFEE